MESSKPQLTLYRALSKSGECGECHYKYAKNEPWYEYRIQEAMKTVNRYLDSGFGIEYPSFYSCPASSEKEAQEAIEALNTRLGRVDPIIHLSHCGDGALVFDRRAEFTRYTLEDRDELILQMLKMPFFKEREIARIQLERGFYDLTAFD